MMTVGCILGLVLLKIMDSKIVLRIFTIASFVIPDVSSIWNAKMALLDFRLSDFVFR